MGQKGGAYERELCKALSEWWTGGARSDVFWRTSNSGGRATVRRGKGLSTHGQQGDVAAVDPVGAPLTRLATIEAKRGYKDCTLGDVLDLNPKLLMKPRPWLVFVKQARRESRSEGTPFWLLVVRRDKRVALVYMSARMFYELNMAGSSLPLARPRVEYTSAKGARYFATTLDQFFARVTPDQVRSLRRELAT